VILLAATVVVLFVELGGNEVFLRDSIRYKAKRFSYWNADDTDETDSHG